MNTLTRKRGVRALSANRSVTVVAVLLAACESGCGQIGKESLNERVANLLVTQDLIETATKDLPGGSPSYNVTRMVAAKRDLPLDLKFSFALVTAYGRFRGTEHYRDTLDSTARLVDVKMDIAAAVLAKLAGDAEFADNLLKNSSARAEAVNKANTMDKFELKVNQELDSQGAGEIVEVATLMTAAKKKEVSAAWDQMRSSILQAMQRHPELMKPFTEQAAPSEDLNKSRQRVKGLLDDAIKKRR